MKHLVKISGSYRKDSFFVLKIPVLPSFRVEHLLEKLGDFESVPSPAAVAEWLRRLTRNQFPFWERRFESYRLRNTIRWRLSFRLFYRGKMIFCNLCDDSASALYAVHVCLTKAKKLVDFFRSLQLNSWQCTVQLSLVLVSIFRVKNTITH